MPPPSHTGVCSSHAIKVHSCRRMSKNPAGNLVRVLKNRKTFWGGGPQTNPQVYISSLLRPSLKSLFVVSPPPLHFKVHKKVGIIELTVSPTGARQGTWRAIPPHQPQIKVFRDFSESGEKCSGSRGNSLFSCYVNT